MGKISLTRTSEYVNRLRSYHIYIDNVNIGAIDNGQTKEFEVGPGTHTIYLKIDWCSSPIQNITIGDFDTISLKIGSFKNARWLMPFSITMCVLNFLVQKAIHVDYFIYLAIPGFLALMYYLSFGRKNYLSWEEETKQQAISF